MFVCVCVDDVCVYPHACTSICLSSVCVCGWVGVVMKMEADLNLIYNVITDLEHYPVCLHSRMCVSM